MGWGFLEEMSLFELKERLKDVRLEREQERIEKHEML
jgi:hypothetical protein